MMSEAGIITRPLNGISTAMTRFPVAIGPTSRFLVDADGTPFPIHGEAAWSLAGALRRDDADHYLSRPGGPRDQHGHSQPGREHVLPGPAAQRIWR